MSEEPEKLYHYTDEKGAEGIKKSGEIRPSLDTQRDATYDQGVYMTPVPPSEATRVIEKNNYDGMRVTLDRVSHVVALDRSAVPQAQKVATVDGRDIYKVDTTQPLKLPPGTEIKKRDN